MKPIHEKIMQEEADLLGNRCDPFAFELAARIITRIEALQDKPRKMLSDKEIYLIGIEPVPGVPYGYAKAIIAAYEAKQLEPVMEKVTVRIYKHTEGEIVSITHPEVNLDAGWTRIDTIERSYPV